MARSLALLTYRLEKIHNITAQAGVLLVLHGVNRFPQSLMRKLIAAGITKINVNRDILTAYYGHLEQRVNKIPFTQLMEEGVDKVADSMALHMDMVMSSGKA